MKPRIMRGQGATTKWAAARSTNKNCAKKMQFYRFALQMILIVLFFSVFTFYQVNTALSGPSPGSEEDFRLKFSPIDKTLNGASVSERNKPKISGNLFCIPIGQIQKMFRNTVKTSISHIDLSIEDIKKIQEIVRANPDDIDSRITLGLIYGNKEEYSKAREEFEFVLTREPQNLIALYSIGLISYFNKDNYNALKYLNRVIELDNGNAYAYYNRGMIEFSRQENKAALTSFRTAIEIDRDFIEARYNMGVIYGGDAHGLVLQGHVGGGVNETEYHDLLKKAIKKFKGVLRLKEDHYAALYNLGLSYLFLGDFEKAFMAANYLEEINPFLGQQLRFRIENPVASH